LLGLTFVQVYIGVEPDFNLLSANYGIYLRGENPSQGKYGSRYFDFHILDKARGTFYLKSESVRSHRAKPDRCGGHRGRLFGRIHDSPSVVLLGARIVIPTDKAQTEAFRANEELNAERI
jgi:hypothetical protein